MQVDEQRTRDHVLCLFSFSPHGNTEDVQSNSALVVGGLKRPGCNFMAEDFSGRVLVGGPGQVGTCQISAATSRREHPEEAEFFGERIENIEQFLDCARRCQGRRDVGQQLFTALLRGLGIEARMIASLQPAGFGWSQAEEGKPKDLEKLKALVKQGHKNSTPSKAKGKGRKANGSKDSPIDVTDEDSSVLSDAISISERVTTRNGGSER